MTVVSLLAASALCLGLAPTLMPDQYSWIDHTTSEAAAQGLSGAWLARLGFLAFGFAVISLATAGASGWSRWARRLHGGFGVCMVAAAAFSHRPFIDGMPFDPVEDVLHSMVATAMGFAFAFGVVVVALQRPKSRRLMDWVAVGASIAIPLAMAAPGASAGLLQRGMFVVAYAWYALEAGRRVR